MTAMIPTTSSAFPPTPDRSETSTPTSTTSKLTGSALKHAPCCQTPLSASNLNITRTTQPLPVPAANSAEIWSQKCHTDHMLTAAWSALSGWSSPTITPYAPLALSPMSSALHYATECFEGMKAYRGFDGKLRLFRPQRNCERMLKSATRIALPGFEPRELQKLIEKFVALEGPRWLPRGHSEGSYLYLRPTMIGTGDALGVQKPTEALLFVIAVCFPPLDEPRKTVTTTTSLPQSLPSLAGAPTAAKDAGEKDDEEEPSPKECKSSSSSSLSKGMRLLASRHDMIRAWPGGFGNAKVGANYGPSLVAQQEARQKGYHQILWLFGDDRQVTEAGASNFFVLWRTKGAKTTTKETEGKEVEEGGERREQGYHQEEEEEEEEEESHLELVTAPLGDGVILDGVTRASVLELARQRWHDHVDVVERPFTMTEVVQAADEGRLVEAFGCGTAFFIAPVADIHFAGADVELPLKSAAAGGGGAGGGVEETKYAMCLKAWLKDIMFGAVPHEWGVVVDEEV